jgi:hypothetical protein
MLVSSVLIVDFLPNEERKLKPEEIMVFIFPVVDAIVLDY